MQDFTLGNKTVKFWQVTGEVIGNQKYSETHVSSSGGGGFVNNSGGYVAAPSVNSTTTINHDFWIKTKDGEEIPIQLKNSDIPLRIGQNISIIYSRRAESQSGWASILVNHSADKYWHLLNYKVLADNLKLAINPKNLKNHKVYLLLIIFFMLFISISVNIISSFLINDPKVNNALGFASVFAVIPYLKFRSKKAAAALQTHLGNLAQQLAQQVFSSSTTPTQ